MRAGTGVVMMLLLARLANFIPRHDHAHAIVTKREMLSCRSNVAANESLGGEIRDPGVLSVTRTENPKRKTYDNQEAGL